MDALVQLIVLGFAVRVVVAIVFSVVPAEWLLMRLRPRSADPRRLAAITAELARLAKPIAVLQRERARAAEELLLAAINNGPAEPIVVKKRKRMAQIDEMLAAHRKDQQAAADERKALQPRVSRWRRMCRWPAERFLTCDFCHHAWAAIAVVMLLGDGRWLTVLAAAGAGYIVPARLRISPPAAKGCASGSCGAAKRV